MKRWFVVLLVVLAVVVLVSPGIVGHLAEKNLKDSISRAEDGTDDYVVTEESFERGWFTAAGRHRIELRHGDIHDAILALTDRHADDAAPALIVHTRIDHGLVPVTSMSRKAGSLKPGLARTVSTLQLDLGDDDPLVIPGTLYSEIGLTGETASRYLLEAGTYSDAETTAEWKGADIRFTTDPSSRSVAYEGHIEPVAVSANDDTVRVEGLRINGTLDKTALGLHVGSVGLETGPASISTAAFGTAELGAASVHLDSDLDEDGRLTSGSRIGLTGFVPPGQADAIDLHLDLAFNRLDARSLQAIMATLEAPPGPTAAPDARYTAVERDLKQLLSAGGEVRVDRLDLTMPAGDVTAQLRLDLPETDAAQAFSWASLLLALTASAEVELSAALVEMVLAANPDARVLIAMGILERHGDIYGVEADYAQGLLTVNGAPMPIPLPGR